MIYLKASTVTLVTFMLIFTVPSVSVAEWNGERAYDWQVQRDQMDRLRQEQKLQQEQMKQDMQVQQEQQERWQQEQRRQIQDQQSQMQEQQKSWREEQRQHLNSRSSHRQASPQDRCGHSLERMQIACNNKDPNYWMYGLSDMNCSEAQAAVNVYCH